MIVLPAAGRQPLAAGRWHISWLLCCRRPMPSSLFGCGRPRSHCHRCRRGAGLSAGSKPWQRTSWSSSASGRHCCLGGKAQWQPGKAVHRAAHLAMGVVHPPPAARKSCHPSSSALPVSIVVVIAGIITSSHRSIVVVVVNTGPHNLHCCHCPCLRHCSSHCYCCQRRSCSPPLMVGCCVTYSVVCRLICHLPFSSSCDRNTFAAGHQPPSPIANLRHALSYPSPSPLLSLVGCCILCPPSSIPTEPLSYKRFHVPTFGLILTYLE